MSPKNPREREGTRSGEIQLGHGMTPDEVMRAVSTGAELALDAVGQVGFRHLTPDDAYNVASLVVHSIGTVLHQPDATIVDVLVKSVSDPGAWREELGDAVVNEALARGVRERA